MAYMDLEFIDHSAAGDMVGHRAWKYFIKKEKGWDPE